MRSGIGDTAEEAIHNAVSYVIESYQRDGIEPPQTVVRYGRVPRVDIQNVTFIKQEA